MQESPQINSFIIRFVHTGPGAGTPLYRGTIRHILTHQEIHFTEWEEAEEFISMFVPLRGGIPFDGPPSLSPPE
jgi:poly-beta-hydroxyalkanoate depolymerase